MSIELRESLPLSRFIYDREWTPLKGAYLYPLRFFADRRSCDPNDYLEVLKVIDVVGTDVAITRGGGLFVRDRGHLNSREEINRLVSTLNVLLCEFALQGLISHPMTDTDIAGAKLIGEYANIVGGGGWYGERTWGPFSLLAAGVRDMGETVSRPGNDCWPVNFYWSTCKPEILASIESLQGARRLKEVASSLPALLAGSAYHASRDNMSETVLTAWIVCEQILSFFWDTHVSSFSDRQRKKRLEDTRTYSAAVRAEILVTAGILEEDTYAALQHARKVRNDLAHRGIVTQSSAMAVMKAMRLMLGWVGVRNDMLPGYRSPLGGIGSPARVLEPVFSFR